MNDDLARLSYRELADRLGISADAARMKAKRKVKAGLWRIIPGNHPSERVMVELPAADLAERVGGEQRERIRPEQSPRTRDPEQVNAIAEQFLTQLAATQERIQALTDQLLEAKEAHRRDAMELAAAETRELGTKAELERTEGELVQLKMQLVMLNHRLKRERMSWWGKMFGNRR
jgi:DNA-binding Lrp family transcriptional regulator